VFGCAQVRVFNVSQAAEMPELEERKTTLVLSNAAMRAELNVSHHFV
jgi:hypothetical protein